MGGLAKLGVKMVLWLFMRVYQFLEIYVKLLRGEAWYLQLVNDIYTEIEGGTNNVSVNLGDTGVCGTLPSGYLYIRHFSGKGKNTYTYITHTEGQDERQTISPTNAGLRSCLLLYPRA